MAPDIYERLCEEESMELDRSREDIYWSVHVAELNRLPAYPYQHFLCERLFKVKLD